MVCSPIVIDMKLVLHYPPPRYPARMGILLELSMCSPSCMFPQQTAGPRLKQASLGSLYLENNTSMNTPWMKPNITNYNNYCCINNLLPKGVCWMIASPVSVVGSVKKKAWLHYCKLVNWWRVEQEFQWWKAKLICWNGCWYTAGVNHFSNEKISEITNQHVKQTWY